MTKRPEQLSEFLGYAGDSSDNDAALCTGEDDFQDEDDKNDEERQEVNEVVARQVTADVIRQHLTNSEY